MNVNTPISVRFVSKPVEVSLTFFTAMRETDQLALDALSVTTIFGVHMSVPTARYRYALDVQAYGSIHLITLIISFSAILAQKTVNGFWHSMLVLNRMIADHYAIIVMSLLIPGFIPVKDASGTFAWSAYTTRSLSHAGLVTKPLDKKTTNENGGIEDRLHALLRTRM